MYVRRVWWPLLFPGVFLINCFFYGHFLSFPLLGEDGASNYSALLIALKSGFNFKGLFPIMWNEGLGQPNLFVTAVWDPFSWIMFLDYDRVDLFRISWALRASCTWLFTYFFVVGLFPSRSKLAILAGLFNVLINFTLTSARGTPLYAGVFNATHAALFPLVLWLFLKSSKQRGWIGWIDLSLALSLLWFLMAYPLGSLIGLTVAFVFLGAYLLSTKRARQLAVVRAMLRFASFCALFLFLPKYGLWQNWSGVVGVSARTVFSGELFTYGKGVPPPLLWWQPAAPLAILLLLSSASLLYLPRFSRPMRAAFTTAVFIVVFSQLVGLARARHPGLERFPRPLYLEFYLPVFYAIGAAWFVASWRRALALPRAFGLRMICWLGILSLLFLLCLDFFPHTLMRRYWVGLFVLVLLAATFRRASSGLSGIKLIQATEMYRRSSIS